MLCLVKWGEHHNPGIHLSTSTPHPLAANNKHVAEIYSPAPLLQLLMTKNFHIFIIYTPLYIFTPCIDVHILMIRSLIYSYLLLLCCCYSLSSLTCTLTMSSAMILPATLCCLLGLLGTGPSQVRAQHQPPSFISSQ